MAKLERRRGTPSTGFRQKLRPQYSLDLKSSAIISIQVRILVSAFGGSYMRKANRKPRPSVPNWVYLDRDGCWNCPDRNHCNSCKANKEMLAYDNKRRKRKEKQSLRSKGVDYE